MAFKSVVSKIITITVLMSILCSVTVIGNESAKEHRAFKLRNMLLENKKPIGSKVLQNNDLQKHQLRSTMMKIDATSTDMFDNVQVVPCTDPNGTVPCKSIVASEGSLLAFYNTHFEFSPCLIYVRYASDFDGDFGVIQFYEGSFEGPPIATVRVEGTGGLDKWTTAGGQFRNGLQGIYDLQIVFESRTQFQLKRSIAINWIQFLGSDHLNEHRFKWTMQHRQDSLMDDPTPTDEPTLEPTPETTIGPPTTPPIPTTEEPICPW